LKNHIRKESQVYLLIPIPPWVILWKKLPSQEKFELEKKEEMVHNMIHNES